MRPLRAIVPMIRDESPVTLAREVAWRVWKPYRSNRLLHRIKRGRSQVAFRNVPYYRPQPKWVNPAEADDILGFANLVSSGKFSFLGYPAAELGLPPSWNRDFVSGLEWQNLPAARLRPVVRHDGSDVKVPWELSRLQFLPVLAKAYLLRGQENHRSTAKTLLSDWIIKNPVGIGVNWTLAMESALRGMSLCLTLSLLQPLSADEHGWGQAVVHSIWEHLLYTEASLEFSHVLRSNHYLGNILGLLCMTTFLEGPGMERRRRFYQGRIQSEILRQVREDGGDYEASLGYHVLVSQMFTGAFLLLRADGREPRPEFVERLLRMHRLLAGVADSEGCVPHVGDCDDGRTELLADDLQQMLDRPVEQRNSLRISGLLGLGGALFGINRKDSSGDLAWYGLQPRQPNDSPLERTRTELFSPSGIAVGRRGESEVIFCALPNGIHGRGSHTHNDKLSVVARVGGHELFSDCGTCFYTRDVAVRNAYRSTRMHNTVMIDGQEQNIINPDPKFAFCIGNEARVTAIEVRESANEILLSASHFGYARLGVEHHRKIEIVENAFVVEDTLRGDGEHDFELRWHLPSIWKVARILNDQSGFMVLGPKPMRLTFLSTAAITVEHKPVRISRTYGGHFEIGTLISVRGRAAMPCGISTRAAWE